MTDTVAAPGDYESPSVPAHLSYSQQNTLSDCGGRYYLEKVQRVPSRPGWANVGGTAVHRVTEQLDLALMLRGEYIADPVVIREMYAAAFQEAIEAEQARSGYEPAEFRASGRASKEWPDKEGPKWWLAKGPDMVRSWVGFRDANPYQIATFDVVTDDGEVQERPAIELDIEFIVWLGDPKPLEQAVEGVDYVRIIGSIDRVFFYTDPTTGETEYYIVDIKSGSRTPIGKAQVLTYRRGLLETWGVDARWAGFWMARTGQSTQAIDVGSIDLEVVDYGYRNAHRQRMAGDFRYHESSLCVACGVNRYCPLFGGDQAGSVIQPWELSSPISLRFPRGESNDGAPTNNTQEQK